MTNITPEMQELFDDIKHGPIAGNWQAAWADLAEQVKRIEDQTLTDKFGRTGIYGRTIDRLYSGFYTGGRQLTTKEIVAMDDTALLKLVIHGSQRG
jgi:hypothetical protein